VNPHGLLQQQVAWPVLKSSSSRSPAALFLLTCPAPPEFKWQEQILSGENEKNIKQSGGINDLKNVKDIPIEKENKAFIQTLGCNTKIF